MKLLALLLALFLTVQPEDAPPVNYSQTQEVCCEDTDLVEEEAISPVTPNEWPTT
jgi:hypothetical protein